ncbi:MAG: hypothetical protein WC724_00800 [Candidatus Paceibacterota bacterium]|jgi:hypothetical protein
MTQQFNQSKRKGPFVPSKISVILAGTNIVGMIDRSALAKDGWKKHSGKAPVAGVEVHSLESQKIDGTDSIAIKGKGGFMTATNGELECFCADHLTGLGYEIMPPGGTKAST